MSTNSKLLLPLRSFGAQHVFGGIKLREFKNKTKKNSCDHLTLEFCETKDWKRFIFITQSNYFTKPTEPDVLDYRRFRRSEKMKSSKYFKNFTEKRTYLNRCTF